MRCEVAKGKKYQVNSGLKILKTNQENIVIPTNEIIKQKGSNIILLACISSISNVDDWSQAGGNSRYCSIQKLNNNLNYICNLLDVNRSKVMKDLRRLVDIGSDEFKLVKREYNGTEVACVEINYKSGGFVNIDNNILETLLSYNLSLNAFKLYTNLLWLCSDNVNNRYVERQLTQEYLLGLIGLSKTSKRLLKKAEDELISFNLIQIKTEWVRKVGKDLNYSAPTQRKYYKIVTT